MMNMKTKLKNRLISGLLAFAMVFGMLPAGLIPSAKAVNLAGAGTMTSVDRGNAFSASFTVTGKGNTNLGLYRFIMVPDASTKGATNVPSYQVGRGFSDQNGANMKSLLASWGGVDESYYYYSDNGIEARAFAGDTVRFPGSGTFSMPHSFEETITYLATNGFLRPDGTPYKVTDTEIPMVALFYQQQGTPTAASAIGTWKGVNLAKLVVTNVDDIENGPVNVITTRTDNIPMADFHNLFRAVPLTLTNVGGETAILTAATVSRSSGDNAVGLYWNIFYVNDAGTYVPLVDGVNGLEIPVQGSKVVYLQRVSSGSGNNFKTPQATGTVSGTTGKKANGTIHIEYASKESNVEVDDPKDMTWSFSRGGYSPVNVRLEIDQWDDVNDPNKTASVDIPHSGTDSFAITGAYFAAGGNADATITGFTEGGDVTILSTDTTTKTITGKNSAGDLTVTVKAVSSATPGTTTKTMSIIYGETGGVVTVNVTVVVKPKSVDDVITVYKDNTEWTSGTPTITVRRSGTATNISAVSVSGGAYTFNLDPGTYEIYDDDGPTDLTFTKTGGVPIQNEDGTGVRVDYYTVTVSTNPAAGGTAWIGSDTTDNAVTSVVARKNTSVTIRAAANGGYSFTNWTGTDGTLTSAVMSRTVTGTKNYTANFGSSSVTIDVLQDGAGDTAGKQVRLVNSSGGQYGNIMTTDASNKGHFELTAVPVGTYTVETRQSSSDTWAPASPDSNLVVSTTGGSATVKYWTLTVNTGANVGSRWADTNPTSTSGASMSVIVLDGGSAYVHARPATGFDNGATWTYSNAGNHASTDGTSGDDLQVTKVTGTLTVTPNYSKYHGTITVKLDGSNYTGFTGNVLVAGGTVSKTNAYTFDYSGVSATSAAVTTDTTAMGTKPTPSVSVSASSRDAEVNYWSYTFHANAGSDTVTGMPANGIRLVGNTISYPTAPSRSGYTFRGWATTAGATTASWTSGTQTITSTNRNFYAVWTANAAGKETHDLSMNYGDKTYESTAFLGAKITTSGVTSYTYKNTTTTGIPGGLSVHYNEDGTVTVTGRPYEVKGPVTVSFTAVASNGQEIDASFTITVGKYPSTISLAPTAGPHYNGDPVDPTTNTAVTPTIGSGPYYNGSTWNDALDQATIIAATGGAAVTWTPSVLGNTNTPVNMSDGNYQAGTGAKLSEVWTNTTANTTVPVQASHTATIRVTLDDDVYTDMVGKTVELKQSGTVAKNGSGILVNAADKSARVVLDNVPDSSTPYEIWLDSTNTGRTITVNGADATVTVPYYHLILTADTNSTMGTRTPATDGIYIGGTTVTANYTANSGYYATGWKTAADGGTATGSTSLSLTLNARTERIATSAPYRVAITVLKDGDATAGAAKVVTLHPATGSDITGTKSGNVTTFTAVPDGTYTIYVDGATTGKTIRTTTSTNGQASQTLYYYTVNYADLTSDSLHGKYGTAGSTQNTWASGEVLAGGLTAGTPGTTKNLNFVNLPGTVPATNYMLSSWSQSRTAGAFDSTANSNRAATKWTVNSSTNSGGAITLTPAFTKDRASITVNVNRNGSVVTSSIDVNLTGPSSYNKTQTTTTGSTVFDSLAAGTYTAGVDGWTTSGSTTKQATIANTYVDQTITLNYYDYHFDANKPSGATGAVSGMPSDPAAPVLTSYAVTQPTNPSLDGYTFQGWATSAAGPAATWSSINTITAEKTFYAIWTPNTVTLANMTAYGALNVVGIRGFTAKKGSGAGHNADNDFTYEVWDGSKWANTATQDGITLNAGDTLAFAPASAPTKAGTVATPVTTSVFRVRAVSKLNGQVSATTNTNATTVTVTIQPTYKVQYDKNTGGNDGSVPGSVPTDSNLYVVTATGQDFSGATGSGGETVVANTITASSTRLTWTGNVRTQSGWASSSTGAVASTFQASTVANAQKIAPSGTLTLYAIWIGKDLTVNSQKLDADYNMNADQWLDSSYYTAGQTPDINLTGLYLPDIVSNGTNADNLTFNVTDIPAFMEYDSGSKTLKLKDNTRVGNAGTYTITVEVTDSGNSNAKATGTVTLEVHKTTPVIDGFKVDPSSTGPYYVGDVVWPETTYVDVHDPYEPTKKLSTPATNSNGERWADKSQTFKSGTNTYSYTYSPADTTNYNTPASVSVTFEAAVRAIALQVQDDDKNAAWSSAYTNSNTPTYDPTASWKKITVKIRNPETSNSPVEKLTWSQTAGAGDSTFRNIKIVESDGVTDRTSPSSLAEGNGGEIILTFEVNIHASGSHTLTYKFDGVAGDGLPSRKTATATYTYTTVAQANKLATPDPDLTRVEVNDGIEHPDGSNDDSTIDYTNEAFKDQDGNVIDEKLGGLHLIFKPITQDTGKDEAANPVDHYVVTLIGEKVNANTPNSITIRPDELDADGYYHYYWKADLTNGPVPGNDYTVEVQAFSRNTALYQNSDKGDDQVTSAGYRELTVDMLTTASFTDKTFNGRPQTGGTISAITGSGTPQMFYADKSGETAVANKTSVNMTETPTDPGLTSNPIHDYYIYVYVPQGTLYLALGTPTAPVAYTASKTTKGSTRSTRTGTNHPNWEIVQAQATMSLAKSTSSGQTMTPADIRPTPTVRYTTGSGTGNAMYNNGVVTGYYDIVYTVTSAPAGSTYTVNQVLTEAELQTFMADKAGTYNFKAEAKYKTGADRNIQFEADVSEASATFSFTTGNRVVDHITLERFEAVNGTTGATGVDTGANLTDNRVVTYGNAVDVSAWTGIGYYNADNAAAAKQMHLDGLRITVYWSGGDPDVYVVGTDTLPSDAAWTSSNTGTANSPAISDLYLTFKGAGVSTNLSFSYGGKTSNTVTYTMAKRPIDYTVVSDVERVWSNNNSRVDGHIEFDLPENLNGDDVAIALSGDRFQTTNVKYDTWVTAGSTPYAADAGYTANGDVGKDKLVRAVNAGTSGSGNDVTGADKAFYKTGDETPGKASIIPRLVNTITLTTNGVEPGKKIVDATVTVVLNDGEGNRGLEQSNPIKYSSGKIKWQILKDGGDPENEADWEEPTDETFLSNRKYRPTITVQANTNHYLELSDKYTLNGFHNGQRTDDDNRYLTTVTVESDNPYHPDWLPDREVLYHNIAVFQGILDLTVTPELQFADFRSSDYDFENYDADKAHHKFQANTVHIESVSVGDSLGKYNIDLRADVLSVWDVSMTTPSGNLLDIGAVLTPLTDTKRDGEMRYREKEDMIRYELDLTGVATTSPGNYILTLTAKGSAKEGTKANDVLANYTFALVVSEPRTEPTPVGESIIVLYWVSLKGKTNDLTGEKIPGTGGRPTFVPKIIGLDGWVFKGWAETDPTQLKDGEKPTLVDPLTITLTADKIYYAYYEKEEVDHIHFVRGYPDGTFRPDNPITRAEVATIIARSCLEGFEEGYDYGNPGGYSDIGTKRWYTSAVSYCSMAGVFAGYPDGTFRPNDYITRQELALVVGRLAGLRVNMGLPFEDADTVNKWARDGVYTCYILGYVDGYNDGTFRPKNNITRAETVKIFNGYLNRGVDAKGLEGMTPFQLDASAGSYQINGTTEYLTWEDVPEKHWAYYEIIEASNDHDFHWPEDENDTSKKEAPPEDWDAVYIEAEWRYRTTYAITWSVSEGAVAETATKVALNKTPVAPEVTADEGRVFLGWALTEGGEVVDLTTIVITGAQTFYGIFADDETLTQPKTFTVSFETGEWADLDGESSVPVEENGVLTTVPAAIAHEGYLFLGWSLTIGGDVIDPTTVIVTEDMSFFAVCEEKPAEPKSLTVTFLSGEHGDLIGETIVTVEEGSALTELPVVTAHEGYDFRGWSRTEGGTAVDPTQLILMEDTLFYALYEEQAQTTPEIPGTLYTVKAYIDGYEDGTFRPKEHITRATVASMIARAYGSDFDESFDYDLSAVSDITPDHWAAKAIGYCLEKGYFSGYPDGTFAPDGTMTRQEFAVVIAKLAGVQENQGLPFTDADSINKWARNYVYTVYVNGWITGYNDGTFKPKNLITRAEAVKIFNAFLGRSTTKESFDQVTEFDHIWSDFSSRNWAYPDIMEATNDHTYYLNEDGVAIWVDPSVAEALTSGETETSEGDQNPEELQMPEEG